MTYTLHIFPSVEDLYDVICGEVSHYRYTFPDEAAAEFWFSEEFGDSDWYFLGDQELQEQRIEHVLACHT